MADRSGGPGRELVFCHSCENEWMRHEHGLTCPECHSDFTEIVSGRLPLPNVYHLRGRNADRSLAQVEPNHDPRQQHTEDDLLPANPTPDMFNLHNHNPWAVEAPDPAEGDIDEIIHDHRPDGSVHFTRITYRSGTPHGAGSNPAAQAASPVIADFQRMVQGFLGPHLDEIAQEQGPTRTRSRSPLPGDDDMFGGHRLGSGLDGIHRGVPPPPELMFTHHTTGGRTTAGLHPRDAQHAQPLANPVGDLPGYTLILSMPSPTGRGQPSPADDSGDSVLQLLFQTLGDVNERAVPDGANRQPPNPFSAIFSSLLNPGAAAHGDAVYTQEALDRVISQLMEANTTSSAPGPATEDAIASLPTKKLDMSMLDDEGKAECSVCMDDVPVGTEVTELPCSHWFHGQCVTAWLSEHDTCPICRKGISKPVGSNGRRSPVPEGLPSWRRPTASNMPGSFGGASSLSPDGTAQNPFHVSSDAPGPSSSPSRPRSRRLSGVDLGRRRSRGGDAAGAGSEHSDGNGNGGGLSGRVRGWFGGSSS